jgi:tripartite ATP-independent transporter DctP family solute receptor
VAGAAASLTVFARSLHAADFNFAQYHNQTTESTLHKRLVEMWAAVGKDTGGRVETRVYPLNNNVPGSDPAALKMLVAGEIQFFTLMGGVIGTIVPATEVQQIPFVFSTAAAAHQVMDGALGAYLREEMAAKGIHGFPTGAFDNGLRQMTLVPRPVRGPGDLAGLRMRVPESKMLVEFFRTFGAEPVVINSSGIYDGIKSGRVDAQENPLAVVSLFRVYELVKFISMTNHMWSGFNLLAHRPTWLRLPADIRTVIDRHVTASALLQRRDQQAANVQMRADLARRGIVFNDVDPAPFRAALAGFYATWKKELGTRCWALLEAAVGRIA